MSAPLTISTSTLVVRKRGLTSPSMFDGGCDDLGRSFILQKQNILYGHNENYSTSVFNRKNWDEIK